MVILLLLIPLLSLITLNNCGGPQNTATNNTTNNSVTFRSVEGNNQIIPRDATTAALMAQLLQVTNNQYKQLTGVTVNFSLSSSIGGSLLDSSVTTDGTGTAHDFYTSGTELGTATVTATTSTGLSTSFTVSVESFAPTSATATTTQEFEYVQLPQASPLPYRSDQILPETSKLATNSASSPIFVTGSAPSSQSNEFAPGVISMDYDNIANPSDSLSVGFSATFPSIVTAQTGTCTINDSSVYALAGKPCSLTSSYNFDRSIITNNGELSASIDSTGGSRLDYFYTNEIPLYTHAITQLSNINTTGNDFGFDYVPLNSTTTYFIGNNSSGQVKLMKYSGSTLFQVSNLNTSGSDNISSLAVLNSTLYFSATNGSEEKLYKTTGSEIYQISNLVPGGNDQVGSVVATTTSIYFVANNGNGQKLYQYNPTTNIISQISNIVSGGNDNIANLTAIGSSVYFSAGPSGTSKAYEYNGTNLNQISDILPNGDDLPNNFTMNGSTLYFSAQASSGITKLFQYANGVVSQTTNIAGSSYDDAITSLAVFNGNLYFVASDANDNRKIYVYNGTSLNQTTNMNSNGTDDPSLLTVYNGNLYFRGTQDGNNYNIFRLNTKNFVSQISMIMGLGGHDNPEYFGVSNNLLLFSAYNKANSYMKIFKYCDPEGDGCT